MDVQNSIAVEPSRGPQTNPEVPEECPGDGRNLELANELQRIDDLRNHAYKNPNSSMAVLGFTHANLAEIGARLGHNVLEVLRGGETAEEDSALTMGAIDVYVRLAKQSVQIAQLEMRSTSVESASNSKKPR